MKRIYKSGLVIAFITVIGTYFTNCAEPLPDLSSEQSSMAAMSASLRPKSTTVGQTAQVVVSNGNPPFVYEIVSGAGAVDAAGVVTPSAGGVLEVRVSDSGGHSILLALSVTVSAPPAASNCTTPWGSTIASGSSVAAFPSATATCPAVCGAPEQRVCNNGVLSGSFIHASCATTACTVKPPKVFPGAITGSLCSTCALEDPNQKDGINRFLLNNDQVSIDYRCKELGYKRGVANAVYTYAEWCYYSNARTKVWSGTAWQFVACRNGNVKSATCYAE